MHSSGELRRGNENVCLMARHCERSEAIQCFLQGLWIVSLRSQ
jgi:hypothetical protein